MATATDVVILFVGLTLWSQQIPNDSGLKAVMPRVEHESNIAHVPTHRAALVFPAGSYVSQVGWEDPVTLPKRDPGNTSEPTLQYVTLDGDSVRFLTNGTTNGSADLTAMKLPRLRDQLCPAKRTLGARYQPPYSGAAAVFTVPEGALRTCLSVPAESGGRLDTRLQLQTNDTLVISASTLGTATTRTKQLRLKPQTTGGPIELMVVNVPESFFDKNSPEHDLDGVSHMNVYEAMVEPSTAACSMSFQQWWDQLDPDGISLCNAGPALTSGAIRVSTSGANFECSNNQWP